MRRWESMREGNARQIPTNSWPPSPCPPLPSSLTPSPISTTNPPPSQKPETHQFANEQIAIVRVVWNTPIANLGPRFANAPKPSSVRLCAPNTIPRRKHRLYSAWSKPLRCKSKGKCSSLFFSWSGTFFGMVAVAVPLDFLVKDNLVS